MSTDYYMHVYRIQSTRLQCVVCISAVYNQPVYSSTDRLSTVHARRVYCLQPSCLLSTVYLPIVYKLLFTMFNLPIYSVWLTVYTIQSASSWGFASLSTVYSLLHTTCLLSTICMSTEYNLFVFSLWSAFLRYITSLSTVLRTDRLRYTPGVSTVYSPPVSCLQYTFLSIQATLYNVQYTYLLCLADCLRHTICLFTGFCLPVYSLQSTAYHMSAVYYLHVYRIQSICPQCVVCISAVYNRPVYGVASPPLSVYITRSTTTLCTNIYFHHSWISPLSEEAHRHYIFISKKL